MNGHVVDAFPPSGPTTADLEVAGIDAATTAVLHGPGTAAVHEARRSNGMNDDRHQIAHLQLVCPEDRPRFRMLGVAANMEGMWARAATPAVDLLLPHLDEERVRWHYPFAEIGATRVLATYAGDELVHAR